MHKNCILVKYRCYFRHIIQYRGGIKGIGLTLLVDLKS